MPLYAYFLAFIYKLFFLNLWAVRVIQLLMGVLNCLLIYLVGKRFFNHKIGVISAILMSGYVMFIFYEILIIPAALIILLNSFVILSSLELNTEPSKKNLIFYGILLGFVSLAEPGILLFALGIMIWFVFNFRKKSKEAIIIRSLFLLSGIFFILSLNLLKNYIAHKDFILVSGHTGINFYIGNNPQATGLGDIPLFLRPSQKGHLEDAQLIAEEALNRRLRPSEVSNFWFYMGLDFIKNDPKSYLSLLLRKFSLFWKRLEPVDTMEFSFLRGDKLFLFLMLNSFGLIGPLGLFGIFLCLKEFRKLFPLYIFVLSQMLAVILFFVTSRYRLVVVPFMIVFGAYGIYWVYLKLKQKKMSNLVYGSLVLFILFGFVNSKNPIRQPTAYNQQLEKHYNLGILNLERGNFDEAIKEFTLAVESEPLDYLSHFALANAYYSTGRIKEAVREYKITIAMKPRFSDAHFNLGHLYQSSGKFLDAEKEYKEVLNLTPDSLDAHYKLALLYKSQKRYKEAILNFEKIAKLDPYYSAAINPLIEECKKLTGKR